MAAKFSFDIEKVKRIIKSNNLIKKETKKHVQDFLNIQTSFFEKVNHIIGRLDTVNSVADIFLDDVKKETLEKFNPLDKVQLAICGYNSSGKTSFIHELLGFGDFLPAGEGAVTARIVKFSYASSEAACLIRYASVSDTTEIEERVDLSKPFVDNMKEKVRARELRKLIKEHLARPETLDKASNDFVEWAKIFVEIRLPAPILELGLDIYDTPGFLNADPPILCQNLLKIVETVQPTLLFLYDNATVSDDSRKAFTELKRALRGSKGMSSNIFFLNTKADVAVIRKNANNNDDDEDEDNENIQLLQKERLERYKLLLNVNEMKNDIRTVNKFEHSILSEECVCFDIFSTVSPNDYMEKLMKSHAIDRIINYATEYDLQPTKNVIRIVHELIDTFFDFVLVTNRRSPEEWTLLRSEAFRWGDEFFKQYHQQIDKIVAEASQRLPASFEEKHDYIKQAVLLDCENRNVTWNEIVSSSRAWNISYLGHSLKIMDFSANVDKTKLSAEESLVDTLVEREVIMQTLLKIILQENHNMQDSVNENSTFSRSKNELICAAYRDISMIDKDIVFNNQLSIGTLLRKTISVVLLVPIMLLMIPFDLMILSCGTMIESILLKTQKNTAEACIESRKLKALKRLAQYEVTLRDMGPVLKDAMAKWIKNEHSTFRNKVENYFKLICRTIEDRQQAYELARSFAPQFARIECLLQAYLDLDMHHGSTPIIEDEIIGKGGFFTVHPASWDGETELVAKKLQDHVTNKDFAYLEAHFHRAVTRLDIPNMTQLKYLYEANNSSFYLLLPRYTTDLHSFLRANMSQITADKAIQIVRNITAVIAHMHAHDLVHRDIKVQNILMDKNEQVYLADFGTCQHGSDNDTFIGSCSLAPDLTTPSATSSSSSRQYSYEGTAVDVYLLGVLMYACAPKDIYTPPSDNIVQQLESLDRRKVPKRYCQLIARCLSKDPKQRPSAKEIAEELDLMSEKPCIVCYEAARAVRLKPCGHNVLCSQCFQQVLRNSNQPQCVICKQVVTGIQEDNDASTFVQNR